MITVKDVYDYINRIAPFGTQESWDNSGFLVGDENQEVGSIMLALDATESIVDEASEKGCSLIVTHHPVIFGKLSEFHPGNVAYYAAQKNVSIISAHTCLDIADGGVNDCLADALGLSNIEKCNDELGLLRIGDLERNYDLDELISFVSERLGARGIKYTPAPGKIRRIAVCGGSGAEFYRNAFECGADAYVTANVKHSYFMEFSRFGFCVIDAGHFCTENTVIKPLSEKLGKEFGECKVVLSEKSCDPAMYWTR